MKEKIKYVFGETIFSIMKRFYSNNYNLLKLRLNFYKDYQAYYKHSHVFKTDNFNKIESELIMDYHGIEKGFLHTEIRYRFAEFRVRRMIINLEKIGFDSGKSTQVAISLKVLSEYYELHHQNEINIEDYFTERVYNIVKTRIIDSDEICKNVKSEEYFRNIEASFLSFSNSRKSIRNFSNELISERKIRSVIDIAKNSPSVCNRQPSKVHFVQNKEIINEILAIQDGLTGFSDSINQIIVLTSNRNYFFSVGERNQFYIDGGIFLMNLLYALHYNKIAACPANWGKEYKDDMKAQRILNLSPAEKIICVIAVGYLEGSVKYTLSKRRSIDEVLNIIS